MGPVEMDLFASRLTTQLSQFLASFSNRCLTSGLGRVEGGVPAPHGIWVVATVLREEGGCGTNSPWNSVVENLTMLSQHVRLVNRLSQDLTITRQSLLGDS